MSQKRKLAICRLSSGRKGTLEFPWGTVILGGSLERFGGTLQVAAEVPDDEPRMVMAFFQFLSAGDEVPTEDGWEYLGSNYAVERMNDGERVLHCFLSTHVYVQLPTVPEEKDALRLR